MTETPNGNGTRRTLDRLAGLSAPVLLGALGIVLWNLLAGVVEGVDANRDAIIELRGAVEALAATVTERTGDRWTATQDAQQQVIQALVDTAQNEALIDAREQLRDHQARLEAIALELARSGRRVDTLEELLGTLAE
jgi:hypothetical protein